jgi:hypothetical protein
MTIERDSSDPQIELIEVTEEDSGRFVPVMSWHIVPGSGKPKEGEQEQEITIIRVCTGMGRGKSTILADKTIASAVELFGDEETGGSDGLIITNMRFNRENFPSSIRNIEIFYDGNIRHIIEKLAEKKYCILALDELDKGISSSQRASIANQVIVSVASDSRKYKCKLLIYSSIPRKGVDSRIRASDTFVNVPQHKLDIDGFPLYFAWDDPERFDQDYERAVDELGQYQYGVQMSTIYQLSYLQTVFRTLDRIAINFEGLIEMAEIGPFTQKFIEWCRTTEVDLVGMSETHVKKFMQRWTHESEMLLPLSPKNLDLVFTELLRLKVLDTPVATEPQGKENSSVVVQVPREPRAKLNCAVCGYQWTPRKDPEKIKQCPNQKCQSLEWREKK